MSRSPRGLAEQTSEFHLILADHRGQDGSDKPNPMRTGTSRCNWTPTIRYEKVEPGDEQILEGREQRELDGVPSFLALRADEEASDEPETP